MKLKVIENDADLLPAKVETGTDALEKFHSQKLREFRDRGALAFSKRASSLLDSVLQSIEDQEMCSNLKTPEKADQALELLSKAVKTGSALFGLGKESAATASPTQSIGLSVLVGWRPSEQTDPSLPAQIVDQ